MKKQPISIRFMAFWNRLPPSLQMSAAYIGSTLFTSILTVVKDMPLWQAFLTFTSESILNIYGLKAVSKTADKHVEQIIAE